MNRNEAVRILLERRNELVECYHIAYLSLFGSVARNEVLPNAKVGVLVKFASPINLFQLLDLKKKLEAILGCSVDIGKPQSLKPQFRAQILQEAIRVY